MSILINNIIQDVFIIMKNEKYHRDPTEILYKLSFLLKIQLNHSNYRVMLMKAFKMKNSKILSTE